MENVYVPRTPQEKAEQRALLQYFKPENKKTVLSALKRAGRFDLIGTGKNCLVTDDLNAGKPFSKQGAKRFSNSDKKAFGKKPINKGKR